MIESIKKRRTLESKLRVLPGCPVIKTLPSNTRSAGLIPGWGANIHMPGGQKTKT